MVEKKRLPTTFTDDSSVFTTYTSLIMIHCEKLFPSNTNHSPSNRSDFILNSMQDLFAGVSMPIPKNYNDCLEYFKSLSHENMGNLTSENQMPLTDMKKYSKSLIIFVILIGIVSFISITGNLCLAKVLYSKRLRLLQTDRIVLCLALSELCLVLIGSPTEIYRFLADSFTEKWLCYFHTFSESFFSSCIIFYHLLGAFDRFVYIHGHTSSNRSSWSKWCRYVSTKSGSLILLFLPLLCSLPLAICNCLHAKIYFRTLTREACIVHYTHEILITLLISFYILPILLSFFLHAKLVYFIRSRHNQRYLTRTAYILPMKRQNLVESQLKRRSNKHVDELQDQVLLSPQNSSYQRLILMNRAPIASSTAMTASTMAAAQSVIANYNPNSTCNSSQSSRSSAEPTSPTSISPPTVLYKINCQATANANRTVILLVLLLSFYVLCWGPHNLYTWYRIYQYNQKTSLSSFNETSSLMNVASNLRRFVLMNYSLYLLSMTSMCFSFIFYFTLNKQARQEFSHSFGCICPWTILSHHRQQKRNDLRHVQYRKRFPNQYDYQKERIKHSQPLVMNNRFENFKHKNHIQNDSVKRTVINYGCHVQCCP
ncbi:hypothetical protein I4U23_000405 [Adineta vaga]|nr:hypothetical protein I4U23_000405 [Adineta vaga]